MQNNIYTKVLFGAVFICLNALAVFAGEAELTPRVARVAAQAQLAENPYEVEISLHWKKEITLRDMMLRAPRRPARQEQVIKEKQKDTSCRGVLVHDGHYVLFPSVCVEEGKYQLDDLTLHFKNGRRIVIAGEKVKKSGEIIWLPVPADVTLGAPSVQTMPVAAGLSLQEAYGEEMTRHLRLFFHAKNVGPLGRTRIKMSAVERGILQVGDALIYQGKVVALVKKVVGSYTDRLGGVSESAFAVIR
ncbi:MAG: hypothetical protein IKP06_07295 [Elusimicrobiaceae bacterium]|nr:hypothetical protein [Elusimicrobiaceae bacterium]